MPAHQALYRHLQLHNPNVIDMDCHAHVSHKDGTWRMSYWVQLPDTIEAENSVHALDPNASVRRQTDAFLMYGDMRLDPKVHQPFCVASSAFPVSPLDTTEFKTTLNQAPNIPAWWTTIIEDAGHRYAALRDWVVPSPAQKTHIDTMLQEAKALIPHLVQHTHIRPILEEQPSNYTAARQRGIDPASVYHLVGIEFKDAYLNLLTIPSRCAPLLRVSPVLNMPGVSRLQSVDFKGHTQGMAQTVSMIGNILGVNAASSTELKQWLRGDGISIAPPEIALPTNVVMTTP